MNIHSEILRLLRTDKQVDRYAKSNRPFFFFLQLWFHMRKRDFIEGGRVSWAISMFHLRKYVIDFDQI